MGVYLKVVGVVRVAILIISVNFSLFSQLHAQLPSTKFVPVAHESLSSAFVRCILKDSRGFMWFGTGNGLIRYDGTNVYRYEHNEHDSKSIPHNRINVLHEDVNQNLWVGTSLGLARYDREENTFVSIDSLVAKNNPLSNKYVTALYTDHLGKLWIGTQGNGLNIYNSKTSKILYLADTSFQFNVSREHYITSLSAVGDQIWVGTKGGIKTFSAKEMSPLALPIKEKSALHKEITQVLCDSRDVIWISTSDREIIRLSKRGDGYEEKKIKFESNKYGVDESTILALVTDKAGNIWVGGEKFGLNYLNRNTLAIRRYEPSHYDSRKLPTNAIRSIYVDDTGITWIGTYNNGAYMIDNHAKKFDTFQRDVFAQGATGDDIRAFAEDDKGKIWFASDGGGIGTLNPDNHTLEYQETINKKLSTRYISSLLYDGAGNLWIGTVGGGVYKLNLVSGSLKNYKLSSNGFGDNKVFCLYQDTMKNIWAGSNGSGLFCLPASGQEFFPVNKKNQITNTAYVMSILEDSNGTLWVATLFGLYELDRGPDNSYNFTWHSTKRGNFVSNNIQTIHQDRGGNVWFGTVDRGLVMLSRQHAVFKNVQPPTFDQSNSIAAILSDVKGNLWIGSDKGLSKYNPGTSLYRRYTTQNGLPSNGFNVNACLAASDGKFYFGSDKGVVAFFPDSVRDSAIKPKVYLADLKIDNQSVQVGDDKSVLTRDISLTDRIELSYNQRSFVIDFAAISFGESSKNQYCYQLAGFDRNWNCVGSAQSATYTNIDPGTYVFSVKAMNNDGLSSEKPATLEIIIHQAPWKTWWAVLLYMLLCSLIVFLFIKNRLEKIKIKNLLALEQLAHEKDLALSESKSQFFTNISHEFRTPLTLIAMPLESLSSIEDLPVSIKERLKTIWANTGKMLRLVNELMDFNKLEVGKLQLNIKYGEITQFVTSTSSVFNDLAAKKNIHFGVHTMIRSLEGWFDHEKLEKILLNLLSNAFKFTADNGTINVTVNVKTRAEGDTQVPTRYAEIVIVDDGIGIAPEELPFIFDKFYQAKSSTKIANTGTGIGLSLAKGLIEFHQGSIAVESTLNRQTKFVILLPIDRHFYNEGLTETSLESAPTLTADPVEPVAADEERDDRGKPLILVVEDNDELRKYISLELRPEFNVVEAKDGDEGYNFASEKGPDLIISDILMPGKSGIELCEEIKSDLKTSHIPFILLTAKTTVDDQILGIAKGADIYITKPFSIRFLKAQVNQIINSRQKLYSRFSQDVYLLPGKMTSNDLDQAFLQKAVDYIVGHLQDSQLGVDAIADLFNLSRMQVYRKVKVLTGKSVVDFIRMVRIKEALKLMETQKYTLSEIAFQTGFNSASYFTRCFKDQYGKAPSEYLEANKK